MATRYRRNPTAIDRKTSRRWGLASLGSVGAGIGKAGAGLQSFDLLNLRTGRAHTFTVATQGVGLGPPVSGSVGASDYEPFTTPREVNFMDFDGTFMTIRETNGLVYSWVHVSFWGITVDISGGGLSIPGFGVATGNAEFHFSDGKPVGGDYELEPDIDLRIREPLPVRVRLAAPEDDAGLRLPGDVLFGFDQYQLRQTTETHQLLWQVIQAMEKSASSDHGWIIEGHTDSIGSASYNKGLARRRAESVANWILAFKPGWRGDIRTVGEGEGRPIASNATEEGRARNRRVEIWRMPKKYLDAS